MSLYGKNLNIRLETNTVIVFVAAALIALMLALPKQSRLQAGNTKPRCLKGFLCKAVMGMNR